MPQGHEPPQLLKQRLFYQGRKFNYEVTRLRLPNGAEGEWECVRHPGGPPCRATDKRRQTDTITAISLCTQGRILEFPAGTLEPGEDAAETIKREIEEETGYRAKTWTKLGEFFLAPGYSDEIIYAFLAQDLEPLETPPTQDDDEDMETVLMTPQELEQAILDGEPIDAKSISSFFLARPFLQNI